MSSPSEKITRRKATRSTQKRRLTRDAWLDLGIDLLRTRGTSGLTLEELTAQAGVTRGSFYWHFDNHTAFLVQLCQKWSDDYTQSVIEAMNEDPGLSPRERLKRVIVIILGRGMAKLDVHFRELATSRPEVMDVVKQVDTERTRFITGLFKDLGISGDDLKTRVHTFVVLHSLESSVHTGLVANKSLEKIAEHRVAFVLS